MLKRVLSSEALKGGTKDLKSQDFRREHKGSIIDSPQNPLQRMQSGQGAKLLQQLVSEQGSKFVAQVEEVSYYVLSLLLCFS